MSPRRPWAHGDLQGRRRRLRDWRGSGLLVGVSLLLPLPVLAGCVSHHSGQLDGILQTIEQARHNGAVRCAPRELALAEAHANFARIELDQGFALRAQQHLAVAAPNAHAALELSPPDRCGEDRDHDGIGDIVDKCPDVPETYNGYLDEDGCPDDPDTDLDGIVDTRDMCPNVPEDVDGYLDDDGCPDPDNDADQILDKVDRCPDRAEDPDGFEDDDGCPEPDNDKDGVLDLEDDCPLDPGPADNKGCPKKPALVVVTNSQIKITQQIHFEFNKATIKPDSFAILDAVVQVLRDYPEITLEIGGHTDNVGAKEYNRKLSQARADAVRVYLTGKGIASARLTSKGYGMDVPIDTNTTDAGRAKNRRVEFLRTEGGKR